MIRAIADMKDLRTLKLGYSSISAEGLRALAVLQKVEKLGIEACAAIDDAALKGLVAWKGLRYVDVQETRVTKAGLDALGKKWG